MTYTQQIEQAQNKFKDSLADGSPISPKPFHDFCDSVSDIVLILAKQLDEKNQAGWNDDPCS